MKRLTAHTSTAEAIQALRCLCVYFTVALAVTPNSTRIRLITRTLCRDLPRKIRFLRGWERTEVHSAIAVHKRSHLTEKTQSRRRKLRRTVRAESS
ncbi:hypothetical protein MHYP_G00067090 [Metynnis hypsauchen]